MFTGCFCEECEGGDLAALKIHNEERTLTSSVDVTPELLAERVRRLKENMVGSRSLKELANLARGPTLTVPGWVAAKIAPAGYSL